MQIGLKKVLIAPDSFKGSLPAIKFCEIAEQAILSLTHHINILKVPMADGGEGTVDAFVYAASGEKIYITVTGPTGKPVSAYYGILRSSNTAVIEMAAASGLYLIDENERNPMLTTSYGTGELIKAALAKGCKNIIIGIGGSATNDGGAGAMQALGFHLLDKNGNEIPPGAQGLLKLEKILPPQQSIIPEDVKFTVACDVENPLLGARGAVYTYALQKGASPDMLPSLENALKRFSEVVKRDLNKDITNLSGGGAAGGMGAGLKAFLNADIQPGFEIIKSVCNLEEIFNSGIDLVITGEGEINTQTLYGKLVGRIAHMASRYNVKVIAVAGALNKDADKLREHGITSMFSIVNKPMPLSQAMENAETLLYDTIVRIFRLLI